MVDTIEFQTQYSHLSTGMAECLIICPLLVEIGLTGLPESAPTSAISKVYFWQLINIESSLIFVSHTKIMHE